MFHSADVSSYSNMISTNMIVSNDGNVTWLSMVIFKSSCSIDVKHFPFDELLDIGVIGVDDHHLGRAPRGAARLDRPRRAVADLQEAHQAAGLAAARQLFALGAQMAEIGAGARPVLEQPRLAHPQVHDPAVVHQVVAAALDEAGMRLRMFIA